MKRYYKIINASKVRGGSNVSICGVIANYEEWSKHCFLPKEGVVGELVGEGYSSEGILLFLKCASEIIVPILPSGVKQVSEYEYNANMPLNLMIGKASQSEIQEAKGDDFVNAFMSQFGLEKDDEDEKVSFSEQEKAIIMLGTASITEADSYGQGANAKEMEFAQFVQKAIKPTQEAFLLYDAYFNNPAKAYGQIKNSSNANKRMIKTFFIFMCTCDGPINEGEQQALDLLDVLCGFPYMTMSEAEKEFQTYFGI